MSIYNGVHTPTFNSNKVNDFKTELGYTGKPEIEASCDWARVSEKHKLDYTNDKPTFTSMVDKVADRPITFIDPHDGMIKPLVCCLATRARFTFVKRDNNGLIYYDENCMPAIHYLAQDNKIRKFEWKGDDHTILANMEQLSLLRMEKLKREMNYDALTFKEHGRTYEELARRIEHQFGQDSFVYKRKQEWIKRWRAQGREFTMQQLNGDRRFYQYGEVEGMPPAVNGWDDNPAFDLNDTVVPAISATNVDPEEYWDHIENGGDPDVFVDSKGNSINHKAEGVQKSIQKQYDTMENATAKAQPAATQAGTYENMRNQLLAKHESELRGVDDFLADDIEMLHEMQLRDFEKQYGHLKNQVQAQPVQETTVQKAYGDTDQVCDDFDADCDDTYAHAAHFLMEDFEDELDEVIEHDKYLEEVEEVLEENEEIIEPTGLSQVPRVRAEYPDPVLLGHKTIDHEELEIKYPNLLIGSPEDAMFIAISEKYVIPAWLPNEARMQAQVDCKIEGIINFDPDEKTILVTVRDNDVVEILVDKSKVDNYEFYEDCEINESVITLNAGEGFIDTIREAELDHIHIEKEETVVETEILEGKPADICDRAIGLGRLGSSIPAWKTVVKVPTLTSYPSGLLKKLREQCERTDGDDTFGVQLMGQLIGRADEFGDDLGAGRLDRLFTNYINSFALPFLDTDLVKIANSLIGDRDFKELKDILEETDAPKLKTLYRMIARDWGDTFARLEKYNVESSVVPACIADTCSEEEKDDILTDGKYSFEAHNIGFRIPGIAIANSSPIKDGEVLKSNQLLYSAITSAYEVIKEVDTFNGSFLIFSAQGTKRVIVEDGRFFVTDFNI